MTRFLLLILLFAFSCKEEGNRFLFEVPVRAQFEMPAGLNPVESHIFILRNVPTNIEALKAQFETGPEEDLIIKPSQAIVRSLFQSETFEFVDEIEISLFDGFDPEIHTEAFITDFVPPTAGSTVLLLPFETNVRDLVDQRFIHLRIKFRLRASSPSFIATEIDLSFDVEKEG